MMLVYSVNGGHYFTAYLIVVRYLLDNAKSLFFVIPIPFQEGFVVFR